MKVTIEIPEELYRRVKAKSALLGKHVRDVTIELYQRWLAEEPPEPRQTSSEEWLAAWIRLGEESLRHAPPGPTASEVLAADRRRLE